MHDEDESVSMRDFYLVVAGVVAVLGTLVVGAFWQEVGRRDEVLAMMAECARVERELSIGRENMIPEMPYLLWRRGECRRNAY